MLVRGRQMSDFSVIGPENDVKISQADNTHQADLRLNFHVQVVAAALQEG
jgi:hypothetical protein